MKRTFINIIPLLTILFLSFSGISVESEPTGAIGDLKYSILPPNAFNRINKGEWVLLDGRDIRNSNLYSYMADNNLTQLLQNGNIPDARGLFIRNMGWQPSLASENKNRKLGSVQNYGTKLPRSQNNSFTVDVKGVTSTNGAHTHPTNFGWGAGRNDPSKIRVDGNSPKNQWYPLKKAGNHSHKIEIKGNKVKGGDPETRPRNIAFYLYLRIN